MSKIKQNRLIDMFLTNQPQILPNLTIKKCNKTNDDWRLIANINGNSYLFILLPCKSPYPSVIKQLLATPGYSNENILLLSTYFSMGTQEFLNKQNINFIDLSGNYRIKRSLGNSNNKQNVFIRMAGRSNQYPSKDKSVDIFSAKSSRIIYALLSNYPKKFLSIDLAKTANVSPALVTKVMANLAEKGFVNVKRRKGITVIEPDLLLDEWASQYSTKKKTIVGRYYLNIKPNENLLKKVYKLVLPYSPAITGSAGASLVAPFADVYMVELYATKYMDKPDGLISVNSGENIRVYQPYDEQIIDRTQSIKDITVVDNIQLYLDLISNPRRGREQAEFLREQAIQFK